MKDYAAIAKAHAIPRLGAELEKIIAPLDALEEVFRPLVRDLTPDMEPAVTFSMEEEE